MDRLIELNNVSYSKNNNVILNSINLEINEGDFISIVGPNSAGKTTLVRIMLGFEECKGSITYYNGLQRKQFLDLVGMIFENSSYSFLCDTVYDEIAFNLKNKGFNQETIKTKVEEISEYLKITDGQFKGRGCYGNFLSEAVADMIAVIASGRKIQDENGK